MSEWWVVVDKDGNIDTERVRKCPCDAVVMFSDVKSADTHRPESAPHRAVLVTERKMSGGGGCGSERCHRGWGPHRVQALWGEYSHLKRQLTDSCLVDGFERALEAIGLLGSFRVRFEKEKSDG